jgi:hypothetical protein
VPISADHDQAAKAMTNPRESEMSAIRTNAVVQQKVTPIDTDLDAVAEEGHHAVTRNG